MKTRLVEIPVRDIIDWDSFHTVFHAALGFPEFYGRNLDAWIDCMSLVDDATAGMSAITVEPGDLLVLLIRDAENFRSRRPEQYEALAGCVADVNQRRLLAGEPPLLALAFG
jgi:hypothetical protein